MNQANVDALRNAFLATLLAEADGPLDLPPERIRAVAETVARGLASIGVLVPSSMSDHDCGQVWDAAAYCMDDGGYCLDYDGPKELREALEWVAKGYPKKDGVK